MAATVLYLLIFVIALTQAQQDPLELIEEGIDGVVEPKLDEVASK